MKVYSGASAACSLRGHEHVHLGLRAIADVVHERHLATEVVEVAAVAVEKDAQGVVAAVRVGGRLGGRCERQAQHHEDSGTRQLHRVPAGRSPQTS